jgi:hypothetical protein
MVKIRNRLDQPLLVHRGKASPLHLLAREAAVIEERELSSPHLMALIAAGAVESHPLGTPGEARRQKKAAAAGGPRTEEDASESGAPKRTGG